MRYVHILSDYGHDIDFNHLLNVARILASEKADSQTIVIALLHHMLEDCIGTHEGLEKLFGKDVASAVEAITMVSDLSPPDTIIQLNQLKGREDESAFKLRVIGVKIACRLDRMRNISTYSKQKQVSIANETKDVYVDLAVLMGMSGIYDELKALAESIVGEDELQAAHENLARI